MDYIKYNKLRKDVLDIMNKHSSRRPTHSRRKSCPALEIPNHFTKTVLSLEKEHFEEIEELVGNPSPPASPPTNVKKPDYNKVIKTISTYGIVLVKNKKE